MDRKKDLGLLLLRIGMGLLFVYYGYGMLAKGPQGLISIGSAFEFFGIKFAPLFWGYAAGIAMLAGGILVVCGLMFRVALFFMLITMIVAARMHFATGQGFMAASHALECAIVFLSLMVTGPGEFSLDAKMKTCCCCRK
jgi:putative oxidoreductase